ncbi:MAG TPA: helix-turn-helix domain-containing protein [Burkholderiales bacterium]|nr:helix-turn-helix domain-containing protein [Burkholderiales bacterium]
MKDGPSIVRIAALVGDTARAGMLTALMGGQALTATELAQVANLTKQTASAHLSKLVAAGLLAVEQQGRHRYFRLAAPDVAELLESLMGVAFRVGALPLQPGPREPALRKARVCYDHLAGDLGVLVYDGLVARKLLRAADDGWALSDRGEEAFARIGIDVAAAKAERRPLCRPCLDWSARRHHLAGALGAALLRRCLELGWGRRSRGSRAVIFSPQGERALRARFGG